jgi:hypothetical protein
VWEKVGNMKIKDLFKILESYETIEIMQEDNGMLCCGDCVDIWHEHKEYLELEVDYICIEMSEDYQEEPIPVLVIEVK